MERRPGGPHPYPGLNMKLSLKSRMRSATICCAVLICASSLSAQDGVTLYKQHCASCHDQISPRIPPRSALQKLSASRILRTLDFGESDLQTISAARFEIG